MSRRQWLALLFFYTTYLFFGASVFYYTELSYEIERRSNELQERIHINEILVKNTAIDNQELQNEILQKLSTYCRKPVTNPKFDEFIPPYVWSFYHSVFFAFTVCSTLGYGNIAPTRTFGRYFMIAYALVGMPVNAILYTYLGDYFGKTFIGIYSKYKAYKMANNKNYVPRRWGMIVQITLYLVPASIVLIFLPSCLFTYFEGWSYSVSVYYSFVTLSTIGFGDFIPTFQPHQEREFGIYFKFYQAFVIIWFVFGLSYLLMLISFIARGMRSKRITRLEHQLSENIKITHNRIWNGVTKDVSYLRTILNEIYLMKFKPIFSESMEDEKFNMLSLRCSSCPEFSGFATYSPLLKRKRAYSENYSKMKSIDEIKEFHYSDTDLLIHDNYNNNKNNNNKIINENPIGNLSQITTTELLSKVVTALATFQTVDEVDEDVDQEDENNTFYCGFNNNKTPLLERKPIIRLNNSSTSMLDSSNDDDDDYDDADDYSHNELLTVNPRKRAKSETTPIIIDNNNRKKLINKNDLTWNGTEVQIKEFLKLRQKSNIIKNKDQLLIINNDRQKQHQQTPFNDEKFISINILESPTVTKRTSPNKYQQKQQPQPQQSGTSSTFIRKANSLKRNHINPFENNNNNNTNNSKRRESRMIHTPNRYLTNTANGRPSLFSMHSNVNTSNIDLLENTTIADLIRALENVHVQDNLPDKQSQTYYYERTKRLGKNSLTPPATFNKTPPLVGTTNQARRRASIGPNLLIPNMYHKQKSNNLQTLMDNGKEQIFPSSSLLNHTSRRNCIRTGNKGECESSQQQQQPHPPQSSTQFLHPLSALQNNKSILGQRRNTMYSHQINNDTTKLLGRGASGKNSLS